MDVRLVERLGVTFRYDTRIGRDITFEQLQERLRRHRHLRRRHGRGAARRARRRPRGHPVRRRLHEDGQPRRAARGGPGRRHHRRRLHRHGLLAHQPPPRRRERDHRLPPHPLASSSSTRRSWARRSAKACAWSSWSARSRSSATRRATSRASASSATASASRTRPAAARPVPIDGHASSWSRPQTVIPAVSQAADNTFLPVESKFEINRGRVRVDPGTYATNVRGVFACGDFVTGPTTLIEAAGHGKKCAYAIDRYLSGRSTRARSTPTCASSARGATRCPSSTTSCRASTCPWSSSRRACRRPTRTSTSPRPWSAATPPTRRSPSRRAA